MPSAREFGDHVEVQQLVERYGLALDEKNYDLLDSVFTPDALLHYTMEDQETKASYGDWKEIFRQFLLPFYWTSHLFSTPLVDFEGEQARSTCRLIASHVQIRKDGERNLWTVYGFYRDRLVRTDAGWRICERLFRGVHSEGEALPADQIQAFPKAPFS